MATKRKLKKKSTSVKKKPAVEKKAATKNKPVKVLKFEAIVNRITEKGASVMFRNVRCNWVNISTPKKPSDDADPQYGLAILIDKDDEKQIAIIRQCIKDVIKATDKFKTTDEKKLADATSLNKNNEDGAVLKDGDKTFNKDGEVYDGMEGNLFIKATTKAKEINGVWEPKVKLLLKNKMNDHVPPEDQADTFYSGMYADVSVNFVAYVFAKKRGVTSYLNGVMFLKKGEKLGGYDPFSERSEVQEDAPFVVAEDEDEEY